MVYSYNETVAASIKYHNEDELAGKVFADKYAMRNIDRELIELTPDDMHWRIANNLALVEQKKFKKPLSAEFIYETIKGFKRIVPQGGVMYGIGNPQYVTLSNCYVLESPQDSYGSILRTDEHLVQISKRRGGTGTDLSHLRPDKTPTRNSSRTSTGTVCFAKRYSNSIREVGQDGRRGALMLTLNVHHPDIIKFTEAKQDLTQITGANMSIRITDEFMNAVMQDKEYEQRWPCEGTPEISKMVPARKVWKTIIKCAWKTAEPGLLFWDNIISESPADCYETLGFRTTSVNPCIPASSKLLTPNGIHTLGKIKIGERVWSRDKWVTVINKVSSGIQDVYKYSTTFGSICCTENHGLLCGDEKIAAKDAESVNIIRGPVVTDVNINNRDIMDGLMLGDGTYHKCSDTITLCVGENDSDYFHSEISNLIHEPRFTVHNYGWDIETTITSKELCHTYKRKIPERFLYGDKDKVAGFLRGLYSANGSVCGCRVTLKASSFDVISGVQQMLSTLGIASYYTTNKPKVVKFSNGDYECKQSYDLNITRDKHLFANIIGFIHRYKQEKLEALLDKKGKKTPTGGRPETIDKAIVSVEYQSTEEVFDITVDGESHTFWCGGLEIANCSELAMCPNDSCRLLVLCLMGYVKDPFTTKAKFDWDAFYSDAQLGQRYLDNIIDIEIECIDKIINKVIENDKESTSVKQVELDLWKSIKDKCEKGRRTGLGQTGLGDCLASLGIKYGSRKAINLTEKIYRYLKFGSYRASVDMAKELGPFPIWSWELEKDNPFLLRFKDESIRVGGETISGLTLYKDMAKYGRRNIANLTTAPAGSVSLQTRTTSSAEPAYFLSSKRRKKGNPGDEGFAATETDASGDSWMVFDVLHPRLQEWMDVTGETDVKKSPWWGCCAEDLDPYDRLSMQAAVQKHLCHSISSTINLPSDTTQKTVAEIYEKAWELGLKGITVYRSGCRDGVIIDAKSTKSEARPRSLPCNVHHTSCDGEPHFVLVGLKDGKPHEVFSGRNGFLPHEIKTGQIVRKRKDYYIAKFDDTDIELSPITASTTEYQDIITRLVSLPLRNGVDMNIIVRQLEKAGEKGGMNSFARGVARVLKKYIPDGTKEHGETCPECAASQMVRQEGCIFCQSCGWSKCY